MHKSATCLCGAVKIDIAHAPETVGACHCGMCRKWSGGIYLGLHVKAAAATITGADAITAYTSSDWAERCFCATCGTNLFYRVTAPGHGWPAEPSPKGHPASGRQRRHQPPPAAVYS